MKYTNLGNSDLKVSRICMGCMGFGNSETGPHSWTVDEQQTREIIKYGLEKGINFFDTAIKYDGTAEVDNKIIERVALLAEKKGVSMTEISLAWLLTKVAAPVVGATKKSHIDGAVGAVEVVLTDVEISFLEELYVPHPLVGMIAQNGK